MSATATTVSANAASALLTKQEQAGPRLVYQHSKPMTNKDTATAFDINCDISCVDAVSDETFNLVINPLSPHVIIKPLNIDDQPIPDTNKPLSCKDGNVTNKPIINPLTPKEDLHIKGTHCPPPF